MIPNDAYWLMETEPASLLAFVTNHGGASERKLRLFACACARRVLAHFVGVDASGILNTAERVADRRQADTNEWHEARARAADYRAYALDAYVLLRALLEAAIAPSGAIAAQEALDMLAGYEEVTAGLAANQDHLARIRELFGNPFRLIDFTPWRTGTAIALASAMYASRDFSTMPILADALQDAGCDNEDVLTHCRDANATHVRGCWVVDGVLGKE